MIFKEYNILLFFFFLNNYFHNIQSLSLEEEKIIKDIRSLFRLKKN